MGSLQIRDGYVLFETKSFLNSPFKSIYTTVFKILYTIPFVYELKTILDWTFTKTSISYDDWLRIEDIRYQLFENKSDGGHNNKEDNK